MIPDSHNTKYPFHVELSLRYQDAKFKTNMSDFTWLYLISIHDREALTPISTSFLTLRGKSNLNIT